MQSHKMTEVHTKGESKSIRSTGFSPSVLPVCVIAKYTSSPTMKINAHAIQSLDDKKTTALELTAAATAASAAITLIPGDAGTPIADKLADLSSYFLIVVCAIYLEKYLVTITGLAAFIFIVGDEVYFAITQNDRSAHKRGIKIDTIHRILSLCSACLWFPDSSIVLPLFLVYDPEGSRTMWFFPSFFVCISIGMCFLRSACTTG